VAFVKRWRRVRGTGTAVRLTAVQQFVFYNHCKSGRALAVADQLILV
jgi:hypothetical protein